MTGGPPLRWVAARKYQWLGPLEITVHCILSNSSAVVCKNLQDGGDINIFQPIWAYSPPGAVNVALAPEEASVVLTYSGRHFDSVSVRSAHPFVTVGSRRPNRPPSTNRRTPPPPLGYAYAIGFTPLADNSDDEDKTDDSADNGKTGDPAGIGAEEDADENYGGGRGGPDIDDDRSSSSNDDGNGDDLDGSKGDDPENKDVSPRGPGGGTLALALSLPRVDILDPASLVHRQICKYYEEPDNFFVGKFLSYRLPEGDDDPELSGKVLYQQ